MKQYLDTLRNILEEGDVKGDRTGTGTISKFGGMMKFSIQHGIWPIPTTREVAHTKISSELEWMIKGMISVQWLKDNNNGIWNAWMGEQSGTIGPMYGEQWRNWNAGIGKELTEEDQKRYEEILLQIADEAGTCIYAEFEHAVEALKRLLAEKTKPHEQGGRGGVDQLQYVIDELKNNPNSRRIVVSVWHAGLLPDVSMSPKENADAGRMALAPCHSLWQVNTADLSNLEILREIAYRDPDFFPEVERAMEMHRSMDSVQLSNYVKLQTNGWLLRQEWIQSVKEDQTHSLHHDHHFELTSKGQELLDAYKEAGKPTKKLSLLCFARSQDVPLGTVFNVGMYSLLAHLLAQQTNMVPWEYTHLMGDYHIYSNQIECVEKQLTRNPLRPAHVLLDPFLPTIDEFNHKNLQVFYTAHEKIVFPHAAV